MKAIAPFLLMNLMLAGHANAALHADACKADVQHYCPEILPGGGAIEACLKKHEKSLSPGCMQYRQAVKQKIIEFTKACGSDIKKNCAGVKPGEGRILACLKQHEATVGADCKRLMQPAK